MTFKIMFFTYILFNMDSINNKCFQECEQRWTLHNGNIYNSVPLDNATMQSVGVPIMEQHWRIFITKMI